MATFSLQSDVKKPRCTKYTHHVQLQEGGGTYQRTAELTIKKSASSIATPLSPSLSNRSVSLFLVFHKYVFLEQKIIMCLGFVIEM